MVCEWGMSDKMGPMSYGAKEEKYFLAEKSRSIVTIVRRQLIDIDEEVRSIINHAWEPRWKILRENIDLLHKLSQVASGTMNSWFRRNRKNNKWREASSDSWSKRSWKRKTKFLSMSKQWCSSVSRRCSCKRWRELIIWYYPVTRWIIP